MERLWSTAPGQGLAPDSAFRAEAELQAELGYGLRPPVGHGTLTPYAGFSMAGNGDKRDWSLGARWNALPAFRLALETSHGEVDGDVEPTTAAMLRMIYRW